MTPVPPDQRDRQEIYRRHGLEEQAARETRLRFARNVCVFASVDDDAIQYFSRLPTTWKAAFSADPAYPVTDQQIAAVKSSGHQAFAWCDCRTTLPADALLMVERRVDTEDKQLLLGWYGQAESAAEFDVAIGSAKLPVAVIGNLSALRPDQLGRVASGEVPWIQETYRNIDAQRHVEPDWRNANAGVGGNCLAVYASATEGATYTPVDAYRINGWYDRLNDSAYVEGFLEDDWKALV